METTPPRAFVYLRISEDRDATLVSVENQRAEVLGLAARLGLPVAATFVDNDFSAFSGKTRPGYQQLVAAVIGSSEPCVVLVWHVDRLYRRPSELEELLGLVERQAVTIETVRGGMLDLNTHEGKLAARFMVTVASYESGHKADRIALAARRSAERGDWHGSRRFGYRPTPDRSATIDPTEGAMIRVLVDRFLAGESLHSLTVWANEQPVPPLRATVWHANTIRQLLASPRIAGLRSYQPRDQRPETPFRAVMGPGRWPGIITPAEFERVLSVLKNPDRRTSRAGENLLSGIARCGRCGAGLVIASSSSSSNGTPRHRYLCKKIPGRPERGGLSVERTALDDAVTAAVLRRLAATTAPVRLDAEPVSLWAAVASGRQRLTDLATDYGRGDLSRSEFQTARSAALSVLAGAEQALSRVARSGALTALPLGDETALRTRWDELGVGQRRAIIMALVDTLTIRPAAGPRGPVFDLSRVELRWRA